jgi:hypothetical protein
VEGRYLQDRDKTYDHHVRTGPGGGVAVGVDSQRFELQLAIDWPKAHVDETEWSFQSASGGTRRIETITNSAPAFSVMAGMHVVRTYRVRVTLLAGLGRFRTPTHTLSVVEHVAPDGRVLSREEYKSDDSTPEGGLAFGADVPVRLTGRLSIVPSVHTVYVPLADYGRNGFVRPSIGTRWTF